MHMLWEYHGERWPVLITNILMNALRAAYLSTSIQDYITLAFEALGPSTTFSEDYKAAVYSNIINILRVSFTLFRSFRCRLTINRKLLRETTEKTTEPGA